MLDAQHGKFISGANLPISQETYQVPRKNVSTDTQEVRARKIQTGITATPMGDKMRAEIYTLWNRANLIGAG